MKKSWKSLRKVDSIKFCQKQKKKYFVIIHPLSTRNSHQIIAKGDFLKRSRFIVLVLVLVWWLCNKRTKWFHCSRRQTGHDFNRLFARPWAEGNGLMEQKFTSNPINIKSKEIKTKIDWNYLLQTSHKSWRNTCIVIFELNCYVPQISFSLLIERKGNEMDRK